MQAWFDFVTTLETRLGKETLEKWVRSLKILQYDACNLYLEAKDAFQQAWFDEQIRPLLKTQLVNSNFHPIKVHLSVYGQEKTPSLPKENPIAKQKKTFFSPDNLDANLSFTSFIVSEKNSLAYQLLFQLSQKSEASSVGLGNFNPIFLYGKESTGKTHLLQATAQALAKKGVTPFYIKAQTFSQHVIYAMREGEMEAFRTIYRNADVLLIDDVHYFGRKNATQEEFFHTFNTLHTLGKQIIITANTNPSSLKDIEPRLISRFEWGLALGLESLEKKELKELLTKKANSLGMSLSEEVFSYLLEEFSFSPGTIRQALETLLFTQHLQEKKNSFTLSEVKNLLNPLLETLSKKALTPQKIIESVAEYFGIQPTDITGNARAREFSFPRQIVMYLCRNRLQMPFLQIGKTLNRDHSTVMSSIKQIEIQLEKKDKDLFQAYVEISKKIS